MACCGLFRFLRRGKKDRSTPSPIQMSLSTRYHRLDSGMFFLQNESCGNSGAQNSTSTFPLIPSEAIGTPPHDAPHSAVCSNRGSQDSGSSNSPATGRAIEAVATAPARNTRLSLTIPTETFKSTPIPLSSSPASLTIANIQSLFRKYHQGIPVTPTSPMTVSQFFTDHHTASSIANIIENIDAVAYEIRSDVKLLYLAGTMVSMEYNISIEEGLELTAKTLGIKREDEKGPGEEENIDYGEVIRLDSISEKASVHISAGQGGEGTLEIGSDGAWPSWGNRDGATGVEIDHRRFSFELSEKSISSSEDGLFAIPPKA